MPIAPRDSPFTLTSIHDSGSSPATSLPIHDPAGTDPNGTIISSCPGESRDEAAVRSSACTVRPSDLSPRVKGEGVS